MRLFTALILFMQVRDDAIPFEVLGLGALMLAVITVIHGAGLDRIVGYYKKRAEKLRQRGHHPQMAMFVFAGTILLMLFLHLTEISIWGIVLHKVGLIPNLRDAVYFSANTYTTLGMGPMALPHSWRELSPMIAIAGLFTFAWTTSEMFNIVGYHHDLVAELSANRKRRIAKKGSSDEPRPKAKPTSAAE